MRDLKEREIQRRAVLIRDEADERILICPFCGENYLHHAHVDVFNRECEDADTTCTATHADGSVEKNGSSKNPSSRRGAVSIQFWCEGCDKISVLDIVQHKGQTFMSWRGEP